MKQYQFIKYNPAIKQLTGCDRATLILSSLEYWFTKKPDGFYKFMEPCQHRLYKKGDSWAEELGCERRCFARSFKKIGVKYNSRMEFDAALDKFQGKMYASFYDRYTNQTFFLRNNTLADEFLKDFSTIKAKPPKKEISSSKPPVSLPYLPLSTDHNGLSYIDAKNTTSDLSKDKSHASDDIIKKMIDIWTAIVQEGRGQIELSGKLVAFLKKALTDKFDNCLQKWKAYCISIARSKFLMGERTPFRATLDWALKFESIHKILSGNYGIGDRSLKLTTAELAEKEKQIEEQKKAKELEQERSLLALEEEIKNISNEPDSVKNFRIKWLHRFGEKNYRELLADCEIKLGTKETDLIIQPPERIIAIRLESQWKPELLSDQPFGRVQIYHYAELMGKPLIFDRWLGGFEEVEAIGQENGKNITSANGFDESIDEIQSTETNQLRASLKESIPAKEYPAWLDGIKVQAIKPDGTLVVNFKDNFTADYARKRFFQEILEAAIGLWSEVADLMLHEESKNFPVYDENEYFRMDERTLLEQAIQSLIGDDFEGAGQGRVILNDTIPY